MIELVGSARFKQLAGARRAGRIIKRGDVQLPGVRKQETGTVEVEQEGERLLRFTVSTGAMDRDKDVVNQAGWKLDRFKSNPVVLWSHQATQFPVGKAVDLTLSPERLQATVRFLPKGYGDASDFAEVTYGLARDGYLSATSVGFAPIAWDFTEDESRGASSWFPGIDFHEQELLEFSICTVPANPEALIDPMLPVQPNPAAQAMTEQAAHMAERAKRRRVLELAMTTQ